MLTIGERIKHYRKQKELTQKQLGDLCEIKDSVIRKYESGRLNPKWETIEKLAVAFDIPFNYLLNVESKRANPMTSLTLSPEVYARLEEIVKKENSYYNHPQIKLTPPYTPENFVEELINVYYIKFMTP